MASETSQKKQVKAIEFPHFPTLQQAIVWRNWSMVPVDRLAKVLQTNEENILQLAEGMGLNVPPKFNKYWLERGYITIIRENWHLLTYEQLFTLLDWTKEKLEFTLKEDDFLYHKLGMFKPYVEQAVYRPLSEKEQAETKKIRETLNNHFLENQVVNAAEPFDFLKKFSRTENSSISDIPRLYKFAYRFSKKIEPEWKVKFEINNQSAKSIVISSANLQILLNIKPDQSLPAESHKIEIEDKVINITSVDEEGILRGLQWLEKQVDVRENSFIIKNLKDNSDSCKRQHPPPVPVT